MKTVSSPLSAITNQFCNFALGWLTKIQHEMDTIFSLFHNNISHGLGTKIKCSYKCFTRLFFRKFIHV